ncbi:MAG TPA: MATE family efflux transporter [Syntrophales bacterium]|nr:MATE family efflux transporter [Syntrophales bacterium]
MTDTSIEGNGLAKDFTLRSLLRFAAPTIFMMIFFGLYTIVDMIFVARYVNTNALSAINIVTPVVNLIVGLATMLATGGSAIIARKMGNGNDREARKNFTLITASCTVIGVLFTVTGLISLNPLVRALGASDDLLPYCNDYLGVLLVFAPSNMLQILFSVLFVTAGKPRLGMLIGITAGLTNAFFDYLLIVVLDMGIQGAALATGIGYSVPAIAGTIFFICNRRGTIFFSSPKFDLQVLGESAFNGSSEMVGQLSTAITTFLFNTAMMVLAGEDGVAAITIMIYSQFLLTTFFIGFSMGVAPVISFNYGSGNHLHLKSVTKISLSITLVVSIAVFVLAFLFGDMIVKIFSPEGSPVYRIARAGFFIFPFAFLFTGLNIFMSALFTALSNGTLSAILSFSRSLLIALGIIGLPGFLGVNGVWLSVPLAELISLCLAVWVLLRNRIRYCYV